MKADDNLLLNNRRAHLQQGTFTHLPWVKNFFIIKMRLKDQEARYPCIEDYHNNAQKDFELLNLFSRAKPHNVEHIESILLNKNINAR